MVTRRGTDPAFPGALAPGQALSLDAALAAHTVNAARAAGLGNITGRVSPGMSADFIVLDQDLFAIPADQIHAVKVRETWFGGRLVHDGSGASRT
jgi:hypothetical protein